MLAITRVQMILNQNASVPVNRLPPEILAHIFSFVQPYSQGPPFPLPTTYNEWLKVTHVCQHWRTTALSFPRLWSHIHVRKLLDRKIAVKNIKRSAQSPLNVYCTILAPPLADEVNILSLVAEQMHRLQELHIHWTIAHETSLWDLIVPPSPAPNLEVLSLIGSWDERVSNLTLPPFFQNITPRLKKLTFTRISSWPHNDFSGLTHLSLFDQRDGRVSLPKFLEILKSSPGLEELLLNHAGPDENSIIMHQERTLALVPLNRLRRIEIGDWTIAARSIPIFLSHLMLPKDVTLCAWGESLGDVSSMLNGDTFHRIHRVVIIGEGLLAQMIGIKDSTLYLHHMESSSQYESLFSGMLLSYVQEMVFCPSLLSMPSSSQLQHLLNGVPSLEKLTLSGIAWGRFHRFLPALGVYDDSDEIVVPNLHSLTLLYHKPGDQFDTLPIILLLNARAEIGHPIENLNIEGCSLRQQEQLSEFAVNIRSVHYGPASRKIRLEEAILDEMWSKITLVGPVLHA